MPTNPQQSDPADIVFTPSQIGRLAPAYIEQRRAARKTGVGLPFGIDKIDEVFLPALPGELITMIGRPGSGKTANLLRWARHRARFLQMNGISNRAVIYVTYEQHVEDLEAFHVASETGVPINSMARGEVSDDEMETIRYQETRRLAFPLWYIGHSQERRKKRPSLTLPVVYQALETIETWQEPDRRGTLIDCVFVDYLTRIPFDHRVESKTIGMDEHLNTLKDMGLRFACPMIVGVQARREVDNYEIQVPDMADGAWCSGVEQISDKIFVTVRPIQYCHIGEQFGSVIVTSPHLMGIGLVKQKLGKANEFWWCMFAPEYNRLEEAEMRDIQLNGDE